MSRLLIFIGMVIGGYIGWWLGEKVGLTTAFIVSGIGSMFGVYAGWWVNREYFE